MTETRNRKPLTPVAGRACSWTLLREFAALVLMSGAISAFPGEQPPQPGPGTQVEPVTISESNHAVYYVNYGRSEAVRTLWLKVLAGTGVTLLDETATPLGAADVTNWAKIWDKPDLVIFEAVGVKPDDFVALRVDGTFGVQVEDARGRPGKQKKPEKKEREYTIYVWDLDLDGDSDQTGVTERSEKEEEIEENFPGVICLPNWDDDDKDHIPDCCVPNGSLDDTDVKINGEADRLDFRDLIIQRIPKIPPGTRVVLKFKNEEDAKKVRVFNEKDEFVLGPESKTKFRTEYTVPNIEASGKNTNETLTYLVEGILPGEQLFLELVAQSAQTTGSDTKWTDIAGAKDTVFIMVAPFLLAPNERPALQAVVPPMGDYPATLLPEHPRKSQFKKEDMEAFYRKHVPDVRQGPGVTFFWQDPIQFGYASVPGPDGKPRILPMVAKLRYKRQDKEGLKDPEVAFVEAAEKSLEKYPYRDSAQGSNPKALLEPDRAVFEPVDFNWESETNLFGGNIEVSWTKPKDAIKPPYGRLGLGKGNALYGDYFEKKQKMQLPIAKPDLDWLSVKHIDEVVMFLKGKDVTMPDVNKARNLLSNWLNENPTKESEPLFYEGKISGKGSVVRRNLRRKLITVKDTDGAVHKLDALLIESSEVVPTSAVGDWVHFYSGHAKYQTYQVAGVLKDGKTFAIVRDEKNTSLAEAGGRGQIWRHYAPSDPIHGDKFYFVEAPMCVLPLRELKVNNAQILFLNPITITIGELLDTDSPGAGRIKTFWRVNAFAQTKLRTVESVIDGLGPTNKIRLPVLFWNEDYSEEFESITAFTPNMNNGALFETTFGSPKPFVLPAGAQGGQNDIFGDTAEANLKAAGYSLEQIHDWYVWHVKEGEVHCAAEVLRDPDPELSAAWWEKEKKP